MEQAVQLFIELEGAEGDLDLRHCLHLNVNSYIELCKFIKTYAQIKHTKFYICIISIKNGLLNIFVVSTVKNLTLSFLKK